LGFANIVYMKVSDIEKHEIVPTPIPVLNSILGGGFPTRIIIEVAGPPASGKSTLALQFMAQAQRMGRPCYYADAERSIGFEEFATNIGVDWTSLEYDKQDYAELLLQNIIDWLDGVDEKRRQIKPRPNAVIVVDAVGALHGKEEMEKEMEGRTIGIQSRMIALFCRKLAPIIDRRNAILILVNHIYVDPSTSATKSSGGQKLDYHKGLALWLKNAYGSMYAPKKSADGTKTMKFIEAEIKNKAKYSGAFDGRKVILELVPKKGFVGEFVAAPEPKKRGPKPKAE